MFNEHINSIGLNDNSFEIHPGMTIANFQTEENTIHLSFQDQFENGQEYQISIKNISDTMGNEHLCSNDDISTFFPLVHPNMQTS